jgi:HD superfamily phosphohydrolase
MFQIVANLRNGIDVDKLDYLNRDAVSFGLPAPLRIQRILRGMRICQGEIHFKASVTSDLLDVFYHRYRMHRYFYQHTTVVAIDRHVTAAMRSLDLVPFLQQEEAFVHQLTDGYVIQAMGDSWTAVQKRTFPRLVETTATTTTGPWLSANIVGFLYEPNPLDQVCLTNGTRLADTGAHASMIMGLSERWSLVEDKECSA